MSGAATRFALAHGLSPSHSDPCLLFIGTRDAFTGERRTSAEHVRIVFGLLLCLSLRSGRPYTVFLLTPSDILAQRSLRINLVPKISPKTFLRKTFFRNFTPSLTLRSPRAFNIAEDQGKYGIRVFRPFLNYRQPQTQMPPAGGYGENRYKASAEALVRKA